MTKTYAMKRLALAIGLSLSATCLVASADDGITQELILQVLKNTGLLSANGTVPISTRLNLTNTDQIPMTVTDLTVINTAQSIDLSFPLTGTWNHVSLNPTFLDGDGADSSLVRGLYLHQTSNFAPIGGVTAECLSVQLVDTGPANITYLARFAAGSSGTTDKFTLDSTGTVFQAGKTTTYNSETLAGNGLVATLRDNNATAQHGADTSVATYTPSVDCDLMIGATVNVTALSAATVTVTVSYTDVAGSARTTVLPVELSGGTAGTYLATGSIVATGDYSVPITTIRAKASNAVTIKTTFSGTSITYSVSGSIIRI